MARERWFFVQGRQRRGPLPLALLVEALVAQGDPRSVLVWRKGLPGWTRAGEVAEVERRFVLPVGRLGEPPPEAPAVAPERARAASRPGSNATVYGAIAAGMLALALVGWLFWPRPQLSPSLPVEGSAGPPVLVPSAAPSALNPTPAPVPAGPVAVTPSAPAPRPVRPREALAPETVLAEGEASLPAAELKRLRGVAAWAGESLRLTVNNGTGWRVTELGVRLFRFTGEDFVPDPEPVVLLPPTGALDAGVAELMNRVAPDRKRAGVNPFDTAPFEARVGPRPESFRWEIASARGYPPLR